LLFGGKIAYIGQAFVQSRCFNLPSACNVHWVTELGICVPAKVDRSFANGSGGQVLAGVRGRMVLKRKAKDCKIAGTDIFDLALPRSHEGQPASHSGQGGG
jgi:hypothetical protein